MYKNSQKVMDIYLKENNYFEYLKLIKLTVAGNYLQYQY